MQTAVMKAVHHDHCYVSPLKPTSSASSSSSASSLLFPNVSGGKVVVVTSQGLITPQGDKLGEEGVVPPGEHGYSQSGSEDEQQHHHAGGRQKKKSISLDLPSATATGSDPGFHASTSGMSFPDYSLPAIIFAQDEEEPSDGHQQVKIDLAAELQARQQQIDKAKAAAKATPKAAPKAKVPKTPRTPKPKKEAPPKPQTPEVVGERKSSRARKPSKKVQEMEELKAEADKKNRKRKFSISFAHASTDEEEEEEEEEAVTAEEETMEAEVTENKVEEVFAPTTIVVEAEVHAESPPEPPAEDQEKPSPKKKKKTEKEKPPPKEEEKPKEEEVEKTEEKAEEVKEEEEKKVDESGDGPPVKKGRGRPPKHSLPNKDEEKEEVKKAKIEEKPEEVKPTRASRSQANKPEEKAEEEVKDTKPTRRTRGSIEAAPETPKPTRGRAAAQQAKSETKGKEKQKVEPPAAPTPGRRSGRNKVEEKEEEKTESRKSTRGQKVVEETKTPTRGRRVAAKEEPEKKEEEPPRASARGKKVEDNVKNKKPEVEARASPRGRNQATEEPKKSPRGGKAAKVESKNVRGRRKEEIKPAPKSVERKPNIRSKKPELEPMKNFRPTRVDWGKKAEEEKEKEEPGVRGRKIPDLTPRKDEIKKDEAKIEESSPEETPKRGRGRPPKLTAEKPDKKEEDVKPKKGRGRPKKDAEPEKKDEDDDEEMPSLELVPSKTEPSTPKKKATKKPEPSTLNKKAEPATPKKKNNKKTAENSTPSKKEKASPAKKAETTTNTPSKKKSEPKTPKKDAEKKASASTPIKSPTKTPKKKKPLNEDATTEEEEDEQKSDISIRFIPDPTLMKTNQWGQAVPLMLLLRIFQQVIKDEGQMPFLSRASRVCRMWYEVSHHPSLWASVDLSGPSVRKYKKSLLWLARKRLGDCTSLNLTGWSSLTDQDVQMVTRYCRNLETLCLAECNKLTSEAVRYIADNCQQLEDIDLSQSESNNEEKSCPSLCRLTERFGSRLRRLSLGNNSIEQPEVLLEHLMQHCPLLEHVDLTDCQFSTNIMKIPLERLQESCPDMKSLLLGNSLFQLKEHKDQDASGFDKLECLDISRSPDRFNKFKYIDDDVLRRFCHSAFDLKELDVSGCVHVTTEGLKSLPIVSLKSLGLGHSKAVLQADIIDVILKWAHSLQKLDFTGNSVSEEMIIRIIDECPNLELIDCSGCRGLPYTCRRQFASLAEVADLKVMLTQQNLPSSPVKQPSTS